MTLREKKVDMIKKNLAYIRLGIERHVVEGDEENARGDQECASWLLHTIEGLVEDVERQNLQEAIDKRNRLNGGYTKAGH